MNMNRFLQIIAALAAVLVFAAGSFGPESALAHHKPGHEQGPKDNDKDGDVTATSVSPQPTPTSTSPQPTPTSVSPQPTPTAGPTSTPEPERAPLAENERHGWGCGDKNHEHIGPAGNPDAESPCDKHDDSEMSVSAEGEDEDEHGNGRGHGKPEKAGKHDED